ncbi:ABC transporter permease [Rhizobium sp. L80/93]|uniref:ABC transporter permease n=1 Tax=unclassified Rhizobium TaxID=2613769 RepID=UPI001ADB7250|nr:MULTISPECIES: ABC transporter permease subunit [unclassified Rhizobium]MBO9186935.1 ABC transporter permease subunit [Rhizobium sp. E27B/91]QYA03779.1 ABC transporter permease subunit [Rhizobium sp. B21/90]
MQADLALLGFGPDGWGMALFRAGLTTLAVSICAFIVGMLLGTLVAWARVAGSWPMRKIAVAYTVVMRGVPDILVIYLFYFGGRQIVALVGQALGFAGPFEISGFVAGMLAIGLISAAYQSEVLRGAYQSVPKGTIEAGRVVGMGNWLLFRRVIAPQAMTTAIPGLGNQWQSVIKESALVSVTGLVEVMRQVSAAAGSTQEDFLFYSAGAGVYLVITTISGQVFRLIERRSLHGQSAGGF